MRGGAGRWGCLLLALALWGVLGVAGAGHAQAQEPTFRLVEIRVADQAAINRLAGRLDVWEVDHQRRILIAAVTSAQQAQLLREGYIVQPASKMETSQMKASLMEGSLVGAAIPNFACYRTVDETYTTLAGLAQDWPQLAQWLDIGDSWRKVRSGGTEGYDLNVLLLTNTQLPGPKPRLFVMAAIHARELATAELATRFAEQLVTRYGHDPEVTWLLDYNEIHILAQANPDGRRQAETNAANDPTGSVEGYWWRKNVNTDFCADPRLVGVDLNRNSSFRWGGCTSGFCSSVNPCDITYRGPSPASEPETQAIEAYIRSLFSDRRGPNDTDAAPPDTQGVMISLHSYSELVLFPWGWSSQPSPNDAGLRTLGRKFGYFTGYQACQAGENWCLYMTDGTTDDFAYGDLGVPAYTFEIGTRFAQQCSDFESNILTQAMAALTYAAKVAVLPYQLPAGPDVVQIALTPSAIGVRGQLGLRVEVDDSRTAASPYNVADPGQAIAAVSYTVDAPSWSPAAGATVGMQPLDTFDSPRETAVATIETLGWAPGRHTIFVQAADAAGNAGPPTAVFVEVGQPLFFPYIGAPQPQKMR